MNGRMSVNEWNNMVIEIKSVILMILITGVIGVGLITIKFILTN